jgi:hypothetical protein
MPHHECEACEALVAHFQRALNEIRSQPGKALLVELWERNIELERRVARERELRESTAALLERYRADGPLVWRKLPTLEDSCAVGSWPELGPALVWDPSEGEGVRMVCFDGPPGHFGKPYPRWSYESGESYHCRFTHWAPLPGPPAQEAPK